MALPNPSYDSIQLPALFEMDDYLHCLKYDKNLYCNIEGKLQTSDNYTNNIFQDSHNNKWTFDRSIIHRALCVPEEIGQNTANLYSHATNLMNMNVNKFNLSVEIDDAACVAVKPRSTMYDQAVLFLLVIYIGLIILSTYNGKTYRNEKGIKKVLSTLSLITTWKQRTEVPKNVDYQKLSSMQGIRILTLSAIIIGHTVMGYNLSFVLNSAEYEQIWSHPLIKIFAAIIMFLVLIFFLLSSWLLSLQIYNIFEHHGEFSLRHVGILIINRYFRIITTVGIIMIFIPTSWLLNTVGPANFSTIILNQQACRQNWIYSILLLSNFQYVFDICNPVTWYISADFQLYVINTMILYMKFKLNFNGPKFYTGLLAASCILHFFLLYRFNAKMFSPAIRNIEIRNFKKSIVFLVSYMSTASILSSSLIGVVMNDIYFRTKNIKVNRSWSITILWMTSFFLLPLLASFLNSMDINGFKAAALGAIVRPLFTLGIGLGILGMSHKIGGRIRKLLEAKYLVILSNFVYCVYLIHFGVNFFVNRYMFSPLYVNIWRTAQDSVVVIILSFLFGIFVTLGVEQPGITAQKKFLPQVTKWVQKLKN